jgi:hypothetical protein
MSILSDWHDKMKQEILHRKARSVAYANNNYASNTILYGILRYYENRRLRWPTFEESLEWANTESGEVSELLLARVPGWVRNNPENKKPFEEYDLMEEIADQVFMLLVAGMVSGYDILKIMDTKMENKLGYDPALIGYDS